MRVAVYCRVSTKAQADEGSSLESQERSCKRLAEARGMKVADVFREDWPGDTLDRPQLRQLRDNLRGGRYQAVVCHATDRLARNPIHIAIIAEDCEKVGAELVFVTEPLDNSPEGQLIRYVKGFAAQVEREKIKERTLRGKHARAAKGMLPQGTGKGAYGYRYDPATGRRRVVESEASVVRQIFGWTIEGASFHAIAQRLNGGGVPSFSGGSWYPLTVRRLVTNPIYKGETYFGQTTRIGLGGRRRRLQPRDESEWILIPEATPPIIPAQEFKSAQEAMRLVRRRSFAKPTQYLLRSHIRCGFCGTRMSGSRLTGGNRYYACRMTYAQYAPRPKCPARYVRADELERQVWAELCRIIESPEVVLGELRRRMNSDTEPLSAEIAERRAELKSAADQQRRLIKLYQFAEIDDDFLQQQAKALKSRQERAETELARLLDVRRSLDNLDDLAGRVTEWTKRVQTNLERLALEEQRLVLEALDVTVVVTPEKWELRGSLPASAAPDQLHATIERTSA